MRKRKENHITMKIKFSTTELGLDYISCVRKDYNKVLRFTYNRLIDNPSYSTKELTAFQSKLNIMRKRFITKIKQKIHKKQSLVVVKTL